MPVELQRLSAEEIHTAVVQCGLAAYVVKDNERADAGLRQYPHTGPHAWSDRSVRGTARYAEDANHDCAMFNAKLIDLADAQLQELQSAFSSGLAAKQLAGAGQSYQFD